MYRHSIPFIDVTLVLACLSVTGLTGCSSSRPAFTSSNKSSAAPPAPSADRSYDYRAISRDCNCKEYTVVDVKHSIEYLFRARYMMDAGIRTTIEIQVSNNSRDSLTFEHGAARVSSRNIAYQYNDKFLPLPDIAIPPGKSQTVKLDGKDRSDEDDWHKIAGEQLTVTVQGLRLGRKEITAQSVIFVPENPMIRER